MARYTFLAMGGGASVSNTVESDAATVVEAYARARFRETWGRDATFVEVSLTNPPTSIPPLRVRNIEADRDEAAVRNARDFGTDPSWYGR